MGEKTYRLNIRHGRIVVLIGAREEVSMQKLARRFGVSVMTIRRGLLSLERAGSVTRTHGGAILSKPRIAEFAFAECGEQYAEEKRAMRRWLDKAAQKVIYAR
jgi:DeoR/GlpR family transcriptional regulator of sugar metabolism